MSVLRPRALAVLAGAALVGGLIAPPVVAEEAPHPEGEPMQQISLGGVEALVQQGEVTGLLSPADGHAPVLHSVQYEDRSLLTPTDRSGATTTTVDVAAEVSGAAPVTTTVDGVTTLAAPARASSDEVETPDYCRDPINGNPTQPAPHKVAVTVQALDRHGDSAPGHFTMMDYHCEPWEANGFILFSVSPGEPRTFYLPPGSYSIIGQVTTRDASGTLTEEITFGGDPQFDVVADQPLDLTVDARDGEPLQLETPETSANLLVVFGWLRGIEGNPPLLESTVLYPQTTSVARLSVIPSEPVSDGEFEFFPWIRATEPMASGTLLGGDSALALDLKLVNPLGSQSTDGATTLRLGLESVTDGDAVLLVDGPDLGAQITAAEAAGATAVLVMPDGDGLV